MTLYSIRINAIHISIDRPAVIRGLNHAARLAWIILMIAIVMMICHYSFHETLKKEMGIKKRIKIAILLILLLFGSIALPGYLRVSFMDIVSSVNSISALIGYFVTTMVFFVYFSNDDIAMLINIEAINSVKSNIVKFILAKMFFSIHLMVFSFVVSSSLSYFTWHFFPLVFVIAAAAAVFTIACCCRLFFNVAMVLKGASRFVV